jgi:hypothetical protein
VPSEEKFDEIGAWLEHSPPYSHEIRVQVYSTECPLKRNWMNLVLGLDILLILMRSIVQVYSTSREYGKKNYAL